MWPLVIGFVGLTVTIAVIIQRLRKHNPGANEAAKPSTGSLVGGRSGKQDTSKQNGVKAPSNPSKPDRTAKTRANPFDNGALTTQTKKCHLWLLDVTAGDIITNDMLAAELDIEPTLGWHERDKVILAVLVAPNVLRLQKNGWRLKLLPSDYAAAQLPGITGQAVPILETHSDRWRFIGFFRLQRPAKLSVSCDLVDGAPPELLALNN